MPKKSEQGKLLQRRKEVLALGNNKVDPQEFSMLDHLQTLESTKLSKRKAALTAQTKTHQQLSTPNKRAKEKTALKLPLEKVSPATSPEPVSQEKTSPLVPPQSSSSTIESPKQNTPITVESPRQTAPRILVPSPVQSPRSTWYSETKRETVESTTTRTPSPEFNLTARQQQYGSLRDEPMQPFKAKVPSYLFHDLPPEVVYECKSAGVLPYAVDSEGNSWVLIRREDRSKTAEKGDIARTWINFGGKKEREDSHPWQTALRELHEESLSIFKDMTSSLSEILQDDHTPKFWHAPGKYLLYFTRVPYDASIPQRFDQEKLAHPDAAECKHLFLRWVSIKDILSSLRCNGCFYAPDCSGVQRLYSYFYALLNNKQVIDLLESLPKVTTPTDATQKTENVVDDSSGKTQDDEKAKKTSVQQQQVDNTQSEGGYQPEIHTGNPVQSDTHLGAEDSRDVEDVEEAAQWEDEDYSDKDYHDKKDDDYENYGDESYYEDDYFFGGAQDSLMDYNDMIQNLKDQIKVLEKQQAEDQETIQRQRKIIVDQRQQLDQKNNKGGRDHRGDNNNNNNNSARRIPQIINPPKCKECGADCQLLQTKKANRRHPQYLYWGCPRHEFNSWAIQYDEQGGVRQLGVFSILL